MQQASSGSSGDRSRLSKPIEFAGRREDTAMFLAQCQMHFRSSPTHFPDVASKIFFVGSFLRGEAFAWFDAVYLGVASTTPPTLPASYEEFALAFRTTFGEDRQMRSDKVLQDLFALQQTSSVQAYSTRFIQLASRLSIDATTESALFRRGLKPDVQKFLLTMPERLNDLTFMVAEASRFDDAFFSISRSSYSGVASSFKSSSSSSPSAAPVAASSSTRGGVAQGRVTTSERARRVANNLCRYCGGVGCPGASSTELCLVLSKRGAGKASADPSPTGV
jgi:hypothetical protein